MLGILLTTLIMIGVLVGSSFLSNYTEIKTNWQTYRCRPDVMIMAPIYGQDPSQNLEFCLKSGFDKRAATTTAPFYTYLASFAGVLTTLLGGVNSVKMTFATIVGTATTVFSQFSQRIQALMYRVQMTAIRMKFLMGRVFGSMYSVLYMGQSGIKAGMNFMNTPLWGFLDTFCFDPQTPILVKGKGYIPIRMVEIGDILLNDEKVTATFQFAANGQPMVMVGEKVLVSTNHYLLHDSSWVLAKDHPESQSAGVWEGGLENPLICLNTDTHSFTLGGYTWKDYDETSHGDKEAMEKVLQMLNGDVKAKCETSDSTMACSPDTYLKYPALEQKQAKDIVLGDELSHGRVAGIIKKLTNETCEYKGEHFAPGTTLWSDEQQRWVRAGDLVVSQKLETPAVYISFIIYPSACIETANGLMFRDYVEIHSPELEIPYAKAIHKESL